MKELETIKAADETERYVFGLSFLELKQLHRTAIRAYETISADDISLSRQRSVLHGIVYQLGTTLKRLEYENMRRQNGYASHDTMTS